MEPSLRNQETGEAWMAVTPPPGMNAASWAYVCNFTRAHESDKTPFMYNNYPYKNTKMDVTCGIGIWLGSADAAASEPIRNMFRIKTRPAEIPSQEMMKKDWKRASEKKRTMNNIQEYGKESELFMDKDAMYEYAFQMLKTRWDNQRQSRNCPELDSFDTMPAQAQIACMSYNYGFYISQTKLMKKAIADGDYDTAGKQSYLKSLDGQKLLAHRHLFYNAARIVEQGTDPDEIPNDYMKPPLKEWVEVGGKKKPPLPNMAAP
jgi:hypothetical protein